MTDDGERLSRLVVRRLNRELAASGLKICAECQGHPLPLDEEHFYRSRGFFEATCKRCHSQRVARRHVERYHSDPAFRERRLQAKREHRQRNLEQEREQDRQYRERKKAEKFAAMLGKGQP